MPANTKPEILLNYLHSPLQSGIRIGVKSLSNVGIVKRGENVHTDRERERENVVDKTNVHACLDKERQREKRRKRKIEREIESRIGCSRPSFRSAHVAGSHPPLFFKINSPPILFPIQRAFFPARSFDTMYQIKSTTHSTRRIN